MPSFGKLVCNDEGRFKSSGALLAPVTPLMDGLFAVLRAHGCNKAKLSISMAGVVTLQVTGPVAVGPQQQQPGQVLWGLSLCFNSSDDDPSSEGDAEWAQLINNPLEALNGAGEVLAHLPAPARQVLPIQRAAAGVTVLFARHIMQHGGEMQDVDGVLQLLTDFCRVAHYSRIIWHLYNPCRPAAAALQALGEQRQPLWWAVAGAPYCQHAAVVPEKHNAVDVASLVALLHDEQLLPQAPVDRRAVVAALHQLLQQYQPQFLTQQQQGGGQQQQARQRPARRLHQHQHQQQEQDVADWLGGYGLDLATVCAAANDAGIGSTIGCCSLCGCVVHKGMGRLIACTCCSHEYHAGCAKREAIFAPDLTVLSSGGGEGVCLACQGFPPSDLFWSYQSDPAGASQQLQQQGQQQQEKKKKKKQQHPAAAAAAAGCGGGGPGRGGGRQRGAAAAAAAAAPPAAAEDGNAAVDVDAAAQHSGDASAGSPACNTRTRQRQQQARQPAAPSGSSSSSSSEESSSSTSEHSQSGDEDDDASAQDAGASQQQEEGSSSKQESAEEEPAQHDYAGAEFDYDEYYRGVADHHGDDDGLGHFGGEGSDGEHQQQEEEQQEEEQLEEEEEQQHHPQDVGSDGAHAAGGDSGSAGGGSGDAEQGSHGGDGAEGENSCSSSSHSDDAADRAAAAQQQRQQHELEHERGSQRQQQQQQEVLVGTQLFAGLDFVAASPSAGPAPAAAAGGAADAGEEEQQAAGLAAARAAAAGHRPVTRSRDAAAAAVLDSPVSQGTSGTKHARQAGVGAHGAAAAAATGGDGRGGRSGAAAAAAGRLSRAGAAAAAREAAAAAGAQQPAADAMDVDPAPAAPAAAAAAAAAGGGGCGGFSAPPFMPPLPSQDAGSPARAARKRLHPTAAAAGQAGSQGAADVPGSQEQEGGRQKRARGREDPSAASPRQQEQLERLRAAQEQELRAAQEQQQQQDMQQHQQQHQAPRVIMLAPAQHQEIRQERRRRCQEALLEQAAACATSAGVIALRRRAGVLYDARLLRHMVTRLLASDRPQQRDRLLAWGVVVLFSTVVPGGDDGSAAAQAASRVLRGSTSFAEVCVAWPPTPPPAAPAAAAAAAAGAEAPAGAASRQAAKAAVAAWDIAALCDPVLDGLLGVLQQQLAVNQQPVHLVPAAANDIGPGVLAAFTGLYHTQGPCAGLTGADADAEDPASLQARRELLLELLPSAHKLLAAIAEQAAANPAAGAQQAAAGAAGQAAAGQAAAAAGSPRSPGSPATGDVSLDAVPFAVPYTLACDAMARVAAQLHDPHRALQHLSHLVRNVATAHARRASELAALDSGVLGAVKPALLLAALQVDEAQPVLSLRRCVLVFGELLTEQVAAFGLPRDAHGQHLPDDLAAEMLLMLARASRCRLATELAAELIMPGSPMKERKVAVETLLPRLQGMMQDAFALLPGGAAAAAAGEAQASAAAVTAFVKQLLRAGAAAFNLLLLEDRSLRNYLEPLRATCHCEGLASFALNVLDEFVAPEVADGHYGNATEGLAWLEQDCVEGMRSLGEQQRQERQRQREQEQEGQQERGQ